LKIINISKNLSTNGKRRDTKLGRKNGKKNRQIKNKKNRDRKKKWMKNREKKVTNSRRQGRRGIKNMRGITKTKRLKNNLTM
jgi:hypothetical protein